MTCRGRGCWGGGESVCFRDRIHGYSSAVTMAVELLWGESVVRKYYILPHHDHEARPKGHRGCIVPRGDTRLRDRRIPTFGVNVRCRHTGIYRCETGHVSVHGVHSEDGRERDWGHPPG
jgi:hypothetical protein